MIDKWLYNFFALCDKFFDIIDLFFKKLFIKNKKRGRKNETM
jgi:hypothetical protein